MNPLGNAAGLILDAANYIGSFFPESNPPFLPKQDNTGVKQPDEKSVLSKNQQESQDQKGIKGRVLQNNGTTNGTTNSTQPTTDYDCTDIPTLALNADYILSNITLQNKDDTRDNTKLLKLIVDYQILAAKAANTSDATVDTKQLCAIKLKIDAAKTELIQLNANQIQNELDQKTLETNHNTTQQQLNAQKIEVSTNSINQFQKKIEQQCKALMQDIVSQARLSQNIKTMCIQEKPTFTSTNVPKLQLNESDGTFQWMTDQETNEVITEKKWTPDGNSVKVNTCSIGDPNKPDNPVYLRVDPNMDSTLLDNVNTYLRTNKLAVQLVPNPDSSQKTMLVGDLSNMPPNATEADFLDAIGQKFIPTLFALIDQKIGDSTTAPEILPFLNSLKPIMCSENYNNETFDGGCPNQRGLGILPKQYLKSMGNNQDTLQENLESNCINSLTNQDVIKNVQINQGIETQILDEQSRYYQNNNNLDKYRGDNSSQITITSNDLIKQGQEFLTEQGKLSQLLTNKKADIQKRENEDTSVQQAGQDKALAIARDREIIMSAEHFARAALVIHTVFKLSCKNNKSDPHVTHQRGCLMITLISAATQILQGNIYDASMWVNLGSIVTSLLAETKTLGNYGASVMEGVGVLTAAIAVESFLRLVIPNTEVQINRLYWLAISNGLHMITTTAFEALVGIAKCKKLITNEQWYKMRYDFYQLKNPWGTVRGENNSNSMYESLTAFSMLSMKPEITQDPPTGCFHKLKTATLSKRSPQQQKMFEDAGILKILIATLIDGGVRKPIQGVLNVATMSTQIFNLLMMICCANNNQVRNEPTNELLNDLKKVLELEMQGLTSPEKNIENLKLAIKELEDKEKAYNEQQELMKSEIVMNKLPSLTVEEENKLGELRQQLEVEQAKQEVEEID